MKKKLKFGRCHRIRDVTGSVFESEVKLLMVFLLLQDPDFTVLRPSSKTQNKLLRFQTDQNQRQNHRPLLFLRIQCWSMQLKHEVVQCLCGKTRIQVLVSFYRHKPTKQDQVSQKQLQTRIHQLQLEFSSLSLDRGAGRRRAAVQSRSLLAAGPVC